MSWGKCVVSLFDFFGFKPDQLSALKEDACLQKLLHCLFTKTENELSLC